MPRDNGRTTAMQGDLLVERLERMAAQHSSSEGDVELEMSLDLPAHSPSVQRPKKELEMPQKKSGDVEVFRRLPCWAEVERAGPNLLMRSSIFGIASAKVPRWVSTPREPRELMVLGDFEISLIGEELRQEDGDVLFGILHLARLTPRPSSTVVFTGAAFLESLGWSRTGSNYHRLHTIVRRLASTTIVARGHGIKPKTFRETGFSLIQYDLKEFVGEENKNEWVVSIPPSTVNLFWVNHYSRIHWDIHKELKSALSRYLHFLYGTFKGPLTFGLEQLHVISGSQQKSLPSFRQSLNKAHEELHKVGILKSWGWDRKKKRLRVEMHSLDTLKKNRQAEIDFIEAGEAE